MAKQLLKRIDEGTVHSGKRGFAKTRWNLGVREENRGHLLDALRVTREAKKKVH